MPFRYTPGYVISFNQCQLIANFADFRYCCLITGLLGQFVIEQSLTQVLWNPGSTLVGLRQQIKSLSDTILRRTGVSLDGILDALRHSLTL